MGSQGGWRAVACIEPWHQRTDRTNTVSTQKQMEKEAKLTRTHGTSSDSGERVRLEPAITGTGS